MNYLFTRPLSDTAIYFKERAYLVANIFHLADIIKNRLLDQFRDCISPRILVSTSHPAYFLSGVFGCWLAKCVDIPKREDQKRSSEIDYGYASFNGSVVFNQKGDCVVEKVEKQKKFSNQYIGDIILTTTGTTGKPKGVVLMLNQLILNAYISGNTIGLSRLCGWGIETDLGLTSGFCHMLMAWVMRVPLTYLRNASTNEKKLFFSQEKVGYGGSPIQALRLVDEIAIGNAPESIMTSGDFFTKPMLEKVRRKFPAVHIHKCYGLTELSGRFCIMPNELLDSTISAVGYPLPGFEVQVLNDAAEPCENNIVGSIFVRSPFLMQGYLREGEFEAVNQKEWFPTNDQGLIDDNHLVHLHGRTNDCFKVGGEKVDRFTIEKELGSLLAEFDYCVLPTPHEVLGFVPILYVSKHDQLSPPNWMTILSHLNNKLPKRFMPMAGKLLDYIPRMPNGKLDRKKIVMIEAVDIKW